MDHNPNLHNLNFNNGEVLYKKRIHCSSFDSETSAVGLPRKKFISEESFAKEMAAMSLDSESNGGYPTIQSPRESFYYPDSSTTNQQCLENKNVIRIDNVDQFLSDEEQQDQCQNSNIMLLDVNENTTIIDNGLPMELRPGESKPRIPNFVLDNSELTDPRDIAAYQNILKHLNKQKRPVRIEVLNEPSDHYIPTAMDLD